MTLRMRLSIVTTACASAPSTAHAARPRHARRRIGRSRGRPPADSFQLPKRHSRHGVPRLGASRRRTTSGSCTCRRSDASAASPAPKRRRALPAAISATRRSAAASSTNTPTRSPAATASRRAVDAAGRRAGEARLAPRIATEGHVGASFPASSRSSSRTASSSSQADIYNRRNERQKVYTVRRLEPIEGIWTVTTPR